MQHTCADILTPNPILLHPKTTLLEALNTIRHAGVRYLPVVDEHNEFKGIFSSLTLLTLLLPSTMSINMGTPLVDLNFMTTNLEELREQLSHCQHEPVSNHLTSKLSTLTPQSTIMEAIHLLYDKHAHVVVLQPNSQQFVGIITINTLLSAIQSTPEA